MSEPELRFAGGRPLLDGISCDGPLDRSREEYVRVDRGAPIADPDEERRWACYRDPRTGIEVETVDGIVAGVSAWDTVVFDGYGTPDSAVAVTLEAGAFQVSFSMDKAGVPTLGAMTGSTR